MALNRNKLTTAVQGALLVGSLVLAGSVFAQDASSDTSTQPETAKTLNTVTVTGSRIRSADLETAQPVFVLDRQ